MRPLSYANLLEVSLLVLALRALSLDTSCTKGETSCNYTAMSLDALSLVSNTVQSPVLSSDMGSSTQRPWLISTSTTPGRTYECYEGSSQYTGLVILPAGELTAEVGKPYNVTCLIDPKLGLQAEDVDFTWNGSPIQETEIDDNRIDATISSTEQGKYNLVCQGGEKVCWRSLRVGYPPLDVENLICISRNWQDLECSWTIPENAAHPASEDYRPYFTDGSHGDKSCDQPYGCQPQAAPECCIWTNATYSPAAKDIQIYFVTQNPLGSATFRHNFSNFAIVMPNPPDKVAAEEKTPLGIQVTWQTPFPLREFPPGLVYRIDHRVSDVQAPPFSAKVGKYSNSSSWEEEVAVAYPGVAYEFEVRLRSGGRPPAAPDQWEDGWSSAVARAAVETRPLAPWTTPEVGLGTYQVKVEELVVMWRPLPRLLHNGPGLRYVVVCADLSNSSIANQTVTEPSATFTNLYPDRPYRVTIQAQNDLGPSNVTSEVVVGTELPAAPRLPVVVYHQEQDHYELRWREEEGLSYTVYVCTNQSQREEPCQGDLSWINVGNVSAVNVTLQEMNVTLTTPKVHFALSAETADDVSSGMAWDSCFAPEHYNTLRTPPSIQATNPKSDSVEVLWTIGCYGRAGIIEELEAICYQDSDLTQCTEDEPCTTSQKDVDSGRVVFENLQPSTNYTVRLRLLYRSGLSEWSVPMPFTTEDPQPPPSLPPWLIATVASGSILVLVVGAVGGRFVVRKIIKTHKNLSRPIVLPQEQSSEEEDMPKPQPSDYQRKNITSILKSLANGKYPQDEDLVAIDSYEDLSRINKTKVDVISNGGVLKQTEHSTADNIQDVAVPDSSNHAYVRLSGYLEDFVPETESNRGHDGLHAHDKQAANETGAVTSGYVLVNDPSFNQHVKPISSQASSEDEEAKADHPLATGSSGYVQCSVTSEHTIVEMQDTRFVPPLGNVQSTQPRQDRDTEL